MPTATKVSTEPHVDFDSQLEPPKRLMRELRRVDPRVDLVYFGHGRWLLGATSPNTVRQAKGRAMLRANRALTIGDESQRAVDRRRLADLAAQGFRFIQMYRFEKGAGGPDHRILQDFRLRDRNWKNALGDHLEEHEREMDGRAHTERTIDLLMEKVDAAKESILKYIFRDATSTVQEDDPLPDTDDEEADDG